MKCFDCQSDISPKDSFCSSCGRDLKGGRRQGGQRQHAPKPDEITGAGLEAYKERMAQMEARRDAFLRKLRMVLTVVAAIVLTFIAAAEQARSMFSIGTALVVSLAVIGSTYIKSGVRLSEAGYAGLPEAKDRHGNHRCVRCGHRGIHRYTPYRTNDTLADCSKCKLPLWW